MAKKILLLSAYDAKSHRLWRERLQNMFPEYQWTQLSQSARNFNWRVRGNSLIWGFADEELLRRSYDLLIVTSMVDLSSLRGFLPLLSNIPTLVYFHENQFIYPANRQRTENIEPKLVPLYAALCADRIVFNSHFNRDSFLSGATELFKKLPNKIPESVVHKLSSSQVIPVPLPVVVQQTANSSKEKPDCLELVWNHRWEYDKGPELLLAVVRQICHQQLPIRIHIVGEQFRDAPPEFKEILQLLLQHQQHFAGGAGEFAYLSERSAYEQLLDRCDIVLSTALHDFQGLAVQEAANRGCTPLAPKALAYPEYLDDKFLYPVDSGLDDAVEAVLCRLKHWLHLREDGVGLPKCELRNYQEEAVKAQYSAMFAELMQ